VAGVIKMVMAMRHELLPPTLHIDRPTPLVLWKSGAVHLATEPVDWPRGERPRRAGVSAFGVSGTNAHIILEEAPEPAESPVPTQVDGVVPWVVSARSGEALRGQASALAAHLAADPHVSPVDVGWSLATTRSVFEHRAVVVGEHRDDLAAGLTALAAGETHQNLIVSDDGPAITGKSAFLFGGLDGWRPGMGAELYDRFPVFAAAFDQVCDQFDGGLEHPVRQTVFTGRLPDHPLYAPAGVFALHVALARLLISAGIQPGMVAGHSVGEIAAAHLAGVLDLSDASRLVAVHAALAGGGPPPDRLRQILGGLSYRQPTIPIISRTGRPVGEDITTTGYWLQHLNEPVPPPQADIEAGVLLGLGPNAAPAEPSVLSVLEREQPEVRTLTCALARLHTGGASVNWAALFDSDAQPRTIRLPTYAFQRRRYWLEQTAPADTEMAAPQTSAETGFWNAVEHEDPEALAEILGITADGRSPLREILPALAALRRQRHQRYRIAWKALADMIAPRLPGTWLLVTAAGREGDPGVAAALREHGADVIEVVVDAADAGRDTLAQRLTEAIGARSVSGVLSLLAADDGAPAVDAGPYAGIAPTTTLLETLDGIRIGAPVWVATRGAVSVDRGSPVTRPEQAQIWGLGSALAIEHRRCWGGLVDLPDKLDDRSGRRLAAVLAGEHGEDEAAVRIDGCFTRRLVRAAPVHATAAHWSPHGTTLITGAGTELGAHTARWLADSGAGHLVLAGAPTPAEDLMAELTAAGAQVSVAAGDPADPEALTAIVAGIPAEHPLTAIVHLAPTLEGDTGRLDVVRIEREWAGTVAAAANLCALSLDHELSAFVLCSSIAGVFSGPGLGNQAPAHAYLNALAQQCRARGVPVTSVSWGSVDEPGVITAADKQLRSNGMNAISPLSAAAMLRQAIERPTASTVLADIDWQWSSTHRSELGTRRLFDDVPEFRAKGWVSAS
jgi:acyl transferase domain-containing protein